MPLLRRSVTNALRVAGAAVCCLGIWCSWTLARADYLFHQDTEASIRSAISQTPDNWKYYMRLAQFDQDHARELLAAALRLDRYNAQADIEMGLQYEAEGDFVRAEHSMLAAYAVNHTYLPRWSLANYYFRRNNMPAFWSWARSAAAMPSDHIEPLLALCWRVSPDPEKITAEIANDQPKFLRQYLNFLLSMNQMNMAAAIAPRLVNGGNPRTDRPIMLSAINKLVAAGHAKSADSLWHLLIRRHWIVGDTTLPNNADFARKPLPVKFDWHLPECSGMYSWPGSSGLQTQFSGSEPESCTVSEQTVVLNRGKYAMEYSYQTSGILPNTGIHWQIVDAKSNAILARSSDLSSDAPKQAGFLFSVPQDASLIRLRLMYQRATGTNRVSGTLTIHSTRIQVHASS